MLTWLLFTLLAIVATGQKQPLSSSSSTSSSSSSSSSDDFDWPNEEVRMVLGSGPRDTAGFYRFEFGRAGTWARQSYLLWVSRPVEIQVWDCYCGGDAFSLYDNGVLWGTTNWYCGDSDGTCNNFNIDPLVCLSERGWCKFVPGTYCPDYDNTLVLSAGFHNLTLLTAKSFFNGGIGFIAAYPAPVG